MLILQSFALIDLIWLDFWLNTQQQKWNSKFYLEKKNKNKNKTIEIY